jgi:NADPH2:quinone reductase
MRAVQLRSVGSTDSIEVLDVPRPDPEPGQVRIRVAAAAVNPVDVAVWSGYFGPPPAGQHWGLGCDAAGVVDAIGARTHIAAGTPVIAMHFGAVGALKAQAEYVVVEEAALSPAPSTIPLPVAATVPMNALTAWAALAAADIRPGEVVLVTGAAGGVGGFAAELARIRGAEVVALAGEADRAWVTETLAVTRFIPRSDDPAPAVRTVHPGGVDIIVDTAMLAGDIIGAARDGGRFITTRADAVPPPQRGITPIAVSVAVDRPALDEIVRLMDAGRLHTRVAAQYPLDRAAEAHARAAAGGLHGRVILTV